jgi:hypothetical protein
MIVLLLSGFALADAPAALPAAVPVVAAPRVSSGCERSYDTWIRDNRGELVSLLASGSSNALTTTGALVTAPVTAGDAPELMGLGASSALGSGSSAAYGAKELLHRRSLGRSLRALQQARVGDGLELRDMAVAIELRGGTATVPQLAALLDGATEPCNPRPKDWDELVDWAADVVAGRAAPSMAPPRPPPPPPPPDTDADGTPDPRDAAPSLAEDVDGFQDDDGVPDPDNDADGVPDADDLCPMVAAGTGPSRNGCRDSDGDGFVGLADRCPTEAPSKGDIVALSQGCASAPGLVHAREATLADGTRFLQVALPGEVGFTAEGGVDPLSTVALDALRAWLRGQPRAVRVEIVVHEDPRDAKDAAAARARTQARADAVRALVAAGGVDPARVSARGAGGAEPLVKAKDKAARALNRRVEVRVLEVGPPGPGEG